MGWSLHSPVGLQEHESREGKSGFPSLLYVLCLYRHVKWRYINEWKPHVCQVILSTLVPSCARGWLAGC